MITSYEKIIKQNIDIENTSKYSGGVQNSIPEGSLIMAFFVRTGLNNLGQVSAYREVCGRCVLHLEQHLALSFKGG
jgi:hypothetical protein